MACLQRAQVQLISKLPLRSEARVQDMTASVQDMISHARCEILPNGCQHWEEKAAGEGGTLGVAGQQHGLRTHAFTHTHTHTHTHVLTHKDTPTPTHTSVHTHTHTHTHTYTHTLSHNRHPPPHHTHVSTTISWPNHWFTEGSYSTHPGTRTGGTYR